MSKVTDTVNDLALPIVQELGMEIVDIEYVKEGKNYFLRVYIDKAGGVDIDECAVVSEKLGEKLDVIDPIPHNYYLEVSSPGAERPLKKEKDFYNAIGKRIYIKTYEPINGEKVFEGQLTAFDGEKITMEIRVKNRAKEIELPYQKVAQARLAVSF